MNQYEAMFIIKPDLSEDDRKTLFSQLADAVTKNSGVVSAGAVWAEKRKLFFPLKKHREGLYYLLSFEIPPLGVKEINAAYTLNENILRVLITRVGR
jgi:small subunit ribosomal protein S6